MVRALYLAGGFLSLGLGGIGIVLPLLPTVPFFILAAFLFARSNPGLERWLLDHARYGRSIRLWREKGAISAAGKRAAFFAFGATLIVSLLVLRLPWSLAPALPMLIIGTWIWRRPEE
nr:MAG: DUF454 domain-containing protein [Hyphomicrobiales bacterium]